MDKQYVVFDLSGEYYGVDIAAVESIIKLQLITSVPRAPAFIEGVTNLRGKVLPVVDLRRRFNLPAEFPMPNVQGPTRHRAACPNSLPPIFNFKFSISNFQSIDLFLLLTPLPSFAAASAS